LIEVVNYTLYMAPGRGAVYTGPDMSTVVRQLSPDTQYSFRVAACTRSGCTLSGEATVTTLEAPPYGLDPPSLTASALGQVLARWAEPRSPNGVLIRYELYRRHGNDTATQGTTR